MNNLKILREINNRSKSEIASILGISKNTYYTYENNFNSISTLNLKVLSKLYNTSIDYILGLSKNPNPYQYNHDVCLFEYTNNLKILRNKNLLTQRDLANILHVSTSCYCKYENNIIDIPVKHIITLAKYYQVSSDYLIRNIN